MHDFAVRDGSGARGAVAAHAAMPHMHGMTAANHAGRDDPHGASHGGSRGARCCTCAAACCAPVAALPVHPRAETVLTAERAFVAPTGRPEHEYVSAWVDFVLPFATAPPTRG